MGIKISPSNLISSGLDIHLALVLRIASRRLAVTKIGTIFETAKLFAEKLFKEGKRMN